MGKTVTVPAESGGGRWRLTAFPTQFTNEATGQTFSGTIIVGVDVSSVYRTVDGLALIDLILLAAAHDLDAVDLNRHAMTAVGRQAVKARSHGADAAIGSKPAQLREREVGPGVLRACVYAIDRDVRDAQIVIDSGVARIDREELRR